MSLHLYPSGGESSSTLADEQFVWKSWRDDSFETLLTANPSDRYGYNLAWYSRHLPKSSLPTQMVRILDYSKANGLNLFENKSYVCAGSVYLQQGGKQVKRSWANIPFPLSVWQTLMDSAPSLKARIQEFNTQTEAKLTSPQIPTGAKISLAQNIGFIDSPDPRIQILLILDRFDSKTLGILERPAEDKNRLTLQYQFDK